MSVLTDLDRAAWRACLDHLTPKPKARRWASPLDMACALDSTIVRTSALELVNHKLVELADGAQNRLLVAMSPQEGKSVLCSKWYPLWKLVDDPSCRVAIVSYSDEMARRWGSDIKQLVETFNGTEGTEDLGLKLRGDSRAAGRWQIDGRAGGVYCVGISGSLTGKPVDCLHGGTEILTEFGYAPIRQVCESGAPFPRVLSFNHRTGQAEWRAIAAVRSVADRPLVEVVTTTGRRIVCTPDHRIHSVSRGYVPAVELYAGERLLAAAFGDDRVQPVREAHPEAPVSYRPGTAGHPAALLEDVPVRLNGGHADLRGLRYLVHQGSMRGREGQAQRLRAVVLYQELLSRSRDSESAQAAHGGSGSRAPRGRRDLGYLGDDPYGDWPTSLLRRGDGSALGRHQQAPSMRIVRTGSQGQGRDVSAVLDEGAGLDVSDTVVFVLRGEFHAHAGRAREETSHRPEELLLRSRMRQQGAQGAGMPLLEVREANGIEGPRATILLEGMPAVGQASRQGSGMPAVWAAVLPQEHPYAVLRPDLRRRGPFGENGRGKQPALQGWHQLRRALPSNASADHRARRGAVSCVRIAGQDGSDRPEDRSAIQVTLRNPPPERGPLGQRPGEPDSALPAVSHDAPQVDHDTVSVVRHLHGVRDTVYDLQVDGNRNFFAGEVLVHNCLIIDDPIKDLSAAQSEAYRKRCRDFWQGVAVPRLGPGAKCLLIQTRWHEEDMAGWLLASEGEGDQARGGRWHVVAIPAQAEDNDPLGRAPGEYMQSARGERDWEAVRKSVGTYVWASLYQQRPAPAEGGLFKRLWWRYWTPAPNLGYGDRVDLAGKVWDLRECWRFITGDLAASTRTSADFTVAAAWALTLNGDLVLLDYNRARIGEAEHYDLFRPLAQRWGVDTAFVEATQHSMTLTAEATRSGLHVTPLKAETDKFSRALPYSARASAGRVWLPAGSPKVEAWTSEHAAFPNSTHDDLVDVGAYAVRVAITKWAPPPPRPTVPTHRDADLMPADPFGSVQPVADWFSVPL